MKTINVLDRCLCVIAESDWGPCMAGGREYWYRVTGNGRGYISVNEGPPPGEIRQIKLPRATLVGKET